MKTDRVLPPTEAQRRKIVALGGDPDLPQTIHDASQLINKLILANPPAGVQDYHYRLRVADQIHNERTQHADYIRH